MVRALIATSGAAIALAVGGCGSGGVSTSTGTVGQGVLAGIWTGRLHQQGLDPFTVIATISSPAGSSGNTVHYTGIDCSGKWSYLGSSGPGHRFREVIDRGKGGKCKGVGVVTL